MGPYHCKVVLPLPCCRRQANGNRVDGRGEEPFSYRPNGAGMK